MELQESFSPNWTTQVQPYAVMSCSHSLSTVERERSPHYYSTQMQVDSVTYRSNPPQGAADSAWIRVRESQRRYWKTSPEKRLVRGWLFWHLWGFHLYSSLPPRRAYCLDICHDIPAHYNIFGCQVRYIIAQSQSLRRQMPLVLLPLTHLLLGPSVRPSQYSIGFAVKNGSLQPSKIRSRYLGYSIYSRSISLNKMRGIEQGLWSIRHRYPAVCMLIGLIPYAERQDKWIPKIQLLYLLDHTLCLSHCDSLPDWRVILPSPVGSLKVLLTEGDVA